MTLTRKQKAYSTVLAVAAVAFGWDRLSGPEKPGAGATDLLVHSSATPQRAPAAAAGTLTGTRARSALAGRLRSVAAANQLDPTNVNSAFSLGPAWTPGSEKAAGITTPQAAPTPQDVVRDFGHRHRLDAVMMRSHGGYAIVDGTGIFIGQQCERFRLVSVTQNSALFAWNDERVVLKILTPGELMRDGTVISNRAGMAPTEAAAGMKDATSP